jgi:hypothetical protein
MARTRRLLVLILALVGFVWIGQGIGLIPGSFMTGQAMWAFFGGALLVAAAVLWVTDRRH